MVKVFVLFGKPVDREAFDQHFNNTHRELLATLPDLKVFRINRVAGAITGDSPFYLIVELEFSSEESMQIALNSESGQTMARDFSNFASGGVTVLLCDTKTAPSEDR